MLETGTKNLLQAIGDNPNRDGLLETPKRVAKAYAEIFSATGETQFDNYKLFPTDQDSDMVIVADIPFYAMALRSAKVIPAAIETIGFSILCSDKISATT